MITKIIKIGQLLRPPDLYRNFAKQVTVQKGLALFINLTPMEYRGVRILETPKSDQVHLLLYCDQLGQVSGKSPTVNLSLKSKKKTEELEKDKKQVCEKLKSLGVEFEMSGVLDDSAQTMNVYFGQIAIELSRVAKILKALEKLQDFFEVEETKDFYKLLESNTKQIILDIHSLIDSSDFNKSNSTYLTVVVKDGDRELKPAEFEPFKHLFVKKALAKVNQGTEGVCHFCGEEKSVSATVNEVFKFATFDKPGFCPSLKTEDAIKVLPICEECKINLQNGANIIVSDLAFDFLSNKLWVVPSLVVEDDDLLKDVIRKIKQAAEDLKDFAKKEKAIEQALSDQDQVVHYDLLFMQINKNQQRIDLHLTEISPTRLRQLVDSAEHAKQRMNIEDLLEPNLGLLWELYEKPTGRTKERKEYLTLVRSIFQMESYNPKRFLWYCMRRIRKAAQNYVSTENEGFGWRKLTYLSFASLLYLNEIGVFNLKRGESKVNGNELDNFFTKYPEFFNESWKKAVFLTGVLAGKVLSIQYAKRQATPFFKKLKGLKMNMQDLHGLLPEIRNKMQQYDSYGQRIDTLMKAAAEYYLESNKQITNIDELNFVFTIGLAYSNREPFKAEEVEKDE
ncbi:MAG: TIGR02556 family CRISPR-associated protein [Pseudothermotoga sp.]